MFEERLVKVLHEAFPAASIPGDIAALAVGAFPEWDSLGNFTFLLAVEEEFNVRFSITEMADLKSIAAIAKVLEQKR
jgi:acyl carrier protein